MVLETFNPNFPLVCIWYEAEECFSYDKTKLINLSSASKHLMATKAQI